MIGQTVPDRAQQLKRETEESRVICTQPDGTIRIPDGMMAIAIMRARPTEFGWEEYVTRTQYPKFDTRQGFVIFMVKETDEVFSCLDVGDCMLLQERKPHPNQKVYFW